jgi:Predicted membrane protein
VTDSILADLIVGPPEFAVAVDGQPVLDAAERFHMVDVRNVLLPFGALLAIATVTLGAIVAVNRRSDWLWRAIARGSGALALVGIVVGVAALFFFDAAFLLFHLVFFPQGNFSFDPRTERLTQLFPDQFWTETSIGIAIVGLVIATGLSLGARWKAARLPE